MSSRQGVYTPRRAVPTLPQHEFNHASALVASYKGPRGATPKTRSPEPSLLTAGHRLDGKPTQPEDFSSCTLSQEHPFEKPRRASQRLCRRPARPALRAFYTPMLNPKRRPVMHRHHPRRPRRSNGPCHCRSYPQQIVPRVAQSILGPAVVTHNRGVRIKHTPE